MQWNRVLDKIPLILKGPGAVCCDHCISACVVSVGGVQHPGAEELHDCVEPWGKWGHRSAAVQIPHHEAHHSAAIERTSQREADAGWTHGMMEAYNSSQHQLFKKMCKVTYAHFMLLTAMVEDHQEWSLLQCFIVTIRCISEENKLCVDAGCASSLELQGSFSQSANQCFRVCGFFLQTYVRARFAASDFSHCFAGLCTGSLTCPLTGSADMIQAVSEQVLSKDVIVCIIKKKENGFMVL